MRRGLLLLAAALGCGLQGEGPDPTAHVRGELVRRLPEAPERLWPALLAALAAEDLRVGHTDAARRLVVAQWRYAGSDATRRLADVADLSPARAAGLTRISDFTVTYGLLLAPAPGGGSLLEIATTIRAADRGGLQPLALTAALPSRGVAERDLLRRLASALYPAEEVLLLTGEPGAD